MNVTRHPDIHNQKEAAHQESSETSDDIARYLKLMRQEAIFSDGALPARLKALAAALWSVSARCEPCIRFYMQKAQELGATREEIGEILAVASAMGGCVGETWAVKAYAAVHENSLEAACCDVQPDKTAVSSRPLSHGDTL